jgi:hypothetical protein
MLNLTVFHEIVHIGENITVKGSLTPQLEGVPVTIVFNSVNGTKQVMTYTFADGTFTAGFQTENIGSWEAQARFDGDKSFYSSSSSSLTIKVDEPTFLMKYSLYIGGGATVAAIVGVVVYVKKFKE